MKAGQQITPTLRLTRLIGKGGMGSVWLADHLTLGTQVAIKFMSIANLDDETLMQRFRTEAKAAAQIKHPHVAQVFDHGVTEEGVPYIVMEFLEGEDLKHAIKRAGPLPLIDVMRIVTQAAKALTRAHGLSIIHRDIKPDNIFLNNLDGEIFVKLLDFGVAKIDQGQSMNGATTTGSMMGTPLYMSPEQLLSARSVDHRSDLWSLAVVTYFALTGRVPFTGETIGSLSVAVHTGVFAMPSTLRPELTPAIDAWFVRMLKRDPNERYQSAKEMAEALEQAIATATGNVFTPSSIRSSFASMAPVSAPPALAQSAPSSLSSSSSGVLHEPSSMISVPQPTFGGTSSDSGRRQGATKKQLYIAVAASAGGVLLVGLIAFAFLFGGSKQTDDSPTPAAATQQSALPIVQPVAPLPPPVETAAQATPSATAAADKPAQDKPKTKTAPSPAPAPKTGGPKPTKDTIGF